MTAIGLVFLWIAPVHAQTAVALTEARMRVRLREVYELRQDLQALFNSETLVALPFKQTAGIKDLQDWARRYGYKEHPALLADFAPQKVALPTKVKPVGPVVSNPRALAPRSLATIPKLKRGVSFNFNSVTASTVLVIDVASREVLLARNTKAVRPIASITKLMTAMVVTERGLPMDRMMVMEKQDEVGGARLRLPVGTALTNQDLFYAMMVGSANNSAYSLARATGLEKDSFVAEMNKKAAELGLLNTVFADPSGLDVGNVSTAPEVAALAFEAYDMRPIRKAASTATYDIFAASETHRMTNTNTLLLNQKNGLEILGSKTGYLNESLWNLAVEMRGTDGQPPIMIVTFGSRTKARSMSDASTLAKWVWKNYSWN